MTTEISNPSKHPKCAKTGLTLPLSRSLDWQDLAQHRAMIAVELEVLAKKFDRFGWDRDRGSMAHDRMITDWMDALEDYTLAEVKTACRQSVLSNPNKMPNEGDIVGQILNARRKDLAARPVARDPEPFRAPDIPVEHRRASAAAILAEVGFAPRRMPE